MTIMQFQDGSLIGDNTMDEDLKVEASNMMII